MVGNAEISNENVQFEKHLGSWVGGEVTWLKWLVIVNIWIFQLDQVERPPKTWEIIYLRMALGISAQEDILEVS